MTLKVKLISCISAFCLILAMLIVGVFAVRNTSLTVGGSIEFKANGIYAEISKGEMSGGSWNTDKGVNGEDKMQGFTIDTTRTESEIKSSTEYKSWSGLHLLFNENGDDVTIIFTITNKHSTDYLTVKPIVSGNSSVINITVTQDKNGMIAPSEIETYTITFHIDEANKEVDASLDSFEIELLLDKPQIENISLYQDKLTFHSKDGNTYAVQAKDTSISGDIEIPAYVKEDGTIYKVTRIEKAGGGTSSNGAFSNCTNVTSITIPETIESIQDYAFENCETLSKFTWNAIAAQAPSYGNIFSGAGTAGFTFVFGKSVRKMSYGVFNHTGSTINKVDFLGTLEDYLKIEFGGGPSNPIKWTGKLVIQGEEVTRVDIPTSITRINGYAFQSCTDISYVNIPNSVTYIGDYAFNGTSITEITIPENVTYIGGSILSNCQQLTKIYYNAISAEGGAAFAGAGASGNEIEMIIGENVRNTNRLLEVDSAAAPNITKLTINSNDLIMDGYWRYGSGGVLGEWKSLKTITINSTNPPKLQTTLGSHLSALTDIYVPSEAVETFKNAEYWSEFADIIKAKS